VGLPGVAAIVAVLVGVPAGTGAPAPGALPASAHLVTLDRQAGIAEAFVPRSQLAFTLRRLRRAPGTRYAFMDRPARTVGGLAGACSTASGDGSANPRWRDQVHASASSSPKGWTVGMVDSGADLGRLGELDSGVVRSFVGRQQQSSLDPAGHGTEVASIIAANRTDLTPNILGIAPGVGLAVAQVTAGCKSAPTTAALVRGLSWLQDPSVLVINVSLTVTPNPALVDALHSLQQEGKLIVAAAGNRGAEPGAATFPASEPHVLAVGALHTLTKAESFSNRASWVDLVAPDWRLPVVQSSGMSDTVEATVAPTGTSFAAPIVAGAAVRVWARHGGWSADQVAAALTSSATPLGRPFPNSTFGYGRLNVAAALRAHPRRDHGEPNDWPSAAFAQPPLVHGPGTSDGLTATVGGRMDPVDLYPVSLRSGERLHVTAISNRNVRISVAGTKAKGWTFRARHSGRYLIRVAAPSPTVYTLTARG
jgi:subtilisin family serine protease